MGFYAASLANQGATFAHLLCPSRPSLTCTLCDPCAAQMIFMNGLFGYLCILIVMKWATGSTADLYHTLIYMFLAVSCTNRVWAGYPVMVDTKHCQAIYVALVCMFLAVSAGAAGLGWEQCVPRCRPPIYMGVAVSAGPLRNDEIAQRLPAQH